MRRGIQAWLLVGLVIHRYRDGIRAAAAAADETSNRDSTYYLYPNFANPLLQQSNNNELYYGDAINILADLQSFQSIYVQYHSCAMVASIGNEGKEVDENDYWYIGATPLAAAQVAFSLYGVKKDASMQRTGLFSRWWFQGKEQSGCHRASFINSFYTSVGASVFTSLLYAAGISDLASYNSDNSVMSSCQIQNNQGSGLACTAWNGGDFTYNQYSISSDSGGSAAMCDFNHVVAVMDSLDDMNHILHNDVQCYELYNADTSSNNNNNNNDNHNNNNNASPIQTLLSNSRSCHVQYDPLSYQYCPDPFGIIQHREQQLLTALKKEATLSSSTQKSFVVNRNQRIELVSYCLFVASGVLFLIMTLLFAYEVCCFRQGWNLTKNNNNNSKSDDDHDKATVASSVSERQSTANQANGIFSSIQRSSVPVQKSRSATLWDSTRKRFQRSSHGYFDTAAVAAGKLELPPCSDPKNIHNVAGHDERTVPTTKSTPCVDLSRVIDDCESIVIRQNDIENNICATTPTDNLLGEVALGLNRPTKDCEQEGISSPCKNISVNDRVPQEEREDEFPDPSFLSIASENSSTGENWKHPILKESLKIDNRSAQNTRTTSSIQHHSHDDTLIFSNEAQLVATVKGNHVGSNANHNRKGICTPTSSCVENTEPQKSALLLSRNLSNEHADADNIHPKRKRLMSLFLNRVWGKKK
jgi:hypothetical protein